MKATSALLVLLLALTCSARADLPRSAKRGISFNAIPAETLSQLTNGVSWAYNWGAHVPPELADPACGIDFYPMLWNAHEDFRAGLTNLLASGYRPKAVFVMNEPNLRGQAFVSPQECARTLRSMQRFLEPLNLRMIGPHYATGASPADSIVAWDPLEKKEVTYTFFLPYHRAMEHYAGATARETGLHLYGNIWEVKWLLSELEKNFPGEAFWISEFNDSSAADEEAALDYLVAAVDLLERSPAVAGYAWFKADMPGDRQSLLTADGELTQLGRAYVEMPAIDTNRWDSVATPIPAAAAAFLHEAQVERCRTGEALAQVRIPKSGGSLQFQLCAAPGVGALEIRLADAAQLRTQLNADTPHEMSVTNGVIRMPVPTQGRFRLTLSAVTDNTRIFSLHPVSAPSPTAPRSPGKPLKVKKPSP